MISLIWLRDLLIDWLLIFLAIAIGLKFWYLIPLSIFIIGNRQHALALLGHDATHKLISKSPFVNYFFGNFFTYAPIGLPWDGYRRFHMGHHRWLGTVRDPELDRKLQSGVVVKNATKKNIIMQFIKDLLGLNILDMKKFNLDKSNEDELTIGFVQLLILLTAFIDWKIPLMWYAAMPTSLLAISRLRIWHEHVGTDKTHMIKATWWQRLLFLPHYAEYHHEHHEKPNVPYNKLKDIATGPRKKVSEIH